VTSIQPAGVIGGSGTMAGSLVTIVSPSGSLTQLVVGAGEADISLALSGTMIGSPHIARIPYGRIGNTRTSIRRE
jgi:hypothetical protein